MIIDEIKNVIHKAQKREIRKFSITIGVFLLLVAAFLFWREKAAAQYFAGIGGGILVLGMSIPIFLKPLYIFWMSFAVIMGFIMTRVILTLFFVIIFTPVGLVMRVLGKDPLKEKIDEEAQTYWIARVRTKVTIDSMENQY